jgi:hypothetical protein
LEKPYYDVDLSRINRRRAVEAIVRWLDRDEELNDNDAYLAKPPDSCVLNVAGSRESETPGIEEAVFQLMVDVLIAVNPACQKFYQLGVAKRVGG